MLQQVKNLRLSHLGQFSKVDNFYDKIPLDFTHIEGWFPSWTWIYQGTKFRRLIIFLLLLWLFKD